MASNPATLSLPPPSPAIAPATPDLPPGGPGGPGAPQMDGLQGAKGLLDMGAMFDRGLLTLMSAMPESSMELRQARQLIQAAFAKFVSKMPEAASSTPAEAGAQFTGGGFQSGGF